MSLADYLLEKTAVYSLWQAPFAAAKLAPMLAHNDMGSARRVLDVAAVRPPTRIFSLTRITWGSM